MMNMMDPKSVIKQMVVFNKTAFESSFKGIELLQEQVDQLAKTMTAQLPAEGKTALDGLSEVYKSNIGSFKTAIDGYFEKVEKYLAD